MTHPLVVTTIATANRLAAVRVLFASVRAWMPDALCVLVLADEVEGRFDPAIEDFTTIPASTLGIPHWERLAFRYTALEYCCALKPFAAGWLLAQHPGATVLYVDSDCWFCARPELLTDSRPAWAMAIVPHRLQPPIQDGVALDLVVRNAGQFNGGLFAVRDGAQDILAWWGERVRSKGFMRLAEGQFADQAWLDFLPVYWADRVSVIRHPGYDVAHWNLPHRPICQKGGRFFAGDHPLVLLHASGFDPEQPLQLSKHAPDFSLAEAGPGAAVLFALYGEHLLAAGWIDSRSWTPAGDRLADGSPLYGYLRGWFEREVEPGLDDQDQLNPFDLDAGKPSLRSRLLQPVEGTLGTVFSRAVYQGDHRAREAYPLVPGIDEPAYLAWLLQVEGMAIRPYVDLLDPIHRRVRDLAPEGSQPGRSEVLADAWRQIDHWRSCADHHIRLAQDLQVELQMAAETSVSLAAAQADLVEHRRQWTELAEHLEASRVRRELEMGLHITEGSRVKLGEHSVQIDHQAVDDRQCWAVTRSEVERLEGEMVESLDQRLNEISRLISVERKLRTDLEALTRQSQLDAAEATRIQRELRQRLDATAAESATCQEAHARRVAGLEGELADLRAAVAVAGLAPADRPGDLAAQGGIQVTYRGRRVTIPAWILGILRGLVGKAL